MTAAKTAAIDTAQNRAQDADALAVYDVEAAVSSVSRDEPTGGQATISEAAE